MPASMSTIIVFAATLVLGWIVPLVVSYAIGPLTSLLRRADADSARPERAYLIVKYATFALAIVVYAGLVSLLTRIGGAIAWPAWCAFAWSTLGALSAISDADRQAWAESRRSTTRTKRPVVRAVRRARR
jgi:hypothetical protein